MSGSVHFPFKCNKGAVNPSLSTGIVEVAWRPPSKAFEHLSSWPLSLASVQLPKNNSGQLPSS